MSVMVTGGCGHVGSFVLKELVERGEKPLCYDVRIPSQGRSEFGGKVQFVKGDVQDITHLLRTIKEKGVDRIVHLVSLLTADSQNDPMRAYGVNVGSMLNVLEAARIMELKRVVYPSSLAVYGRTPKGHPVPEADPKAPVSVYGATKVFNEHLGMTYHERFGVDFVAVRLPVIWGPGLGEYGADSFTRGAAANKFANIIDKAAREEGAVLTAGSHELELLYVKDAAHAIVLALFAEELDHRVFNAGCGCLISPREFVEIVKTYFPNVSVKIEEGYDYTVVPCGDYLDITRAKKELGYEPKFPPVEAVKDYVHGMKEREGVSHGHTRNFG
jgi:nucleoside-diphosphate-sugar epimerase